MPNSAFLFAESLLIAMPAISLARIFADKNDCMNQLQIQITRLHPSYISEASPFMNNSYRESRASRTTYGGILSTSKIFLPKLELPRSTITFIQNKMKFTNYSSNFFESMNVLNTTLVEAEDVYVNVGQFFFHGNKTYYDSSKCMGYANRLGNHKFNTVVGSYDMIVGFQSSHYQFGHLLLDHFAYLFYIPTDIVRNGFYLYNTDAPYVKEYLSLLDIPSSHIIHAKVDQIYYAKRYFFFSPMQCHSTSPYNNHVLSSLLRKTISLPEDGAEPPWRYAIYSRLNTRQIVNLLEFLECFQSLVPINSVVEIFGDFTTRFETGHFYYETAMMFHVHGSAFTNLIFMQKGAIFLEQHVQPTYYLGVHMAYTFGIHSVFTNSMPGKLQVPTVDIDLSRESKMINLGLSYLRIMTH